MTEPMIEVRNFRKVMESIRPSTISALPSTGARSSACWGPMARARPSCWPPTTWLKQNGLAMGETADFSAWGSVLTLFTGGLFLLFALVACRPAGTAVTSRMPSDEVSAPGCPLPEEAPGTYEVIAAAQGICFLYPDTYNAFQAEDGTITLYVRSMLNDHVPLASISVTPSGGQTLEALATQRLADYAWPDTQPESIMLGGETAVMLDNLPGQDTNRRVVTVHEDRVYDMVFHGIGANYGAAGELAEALYETVIASFQFIDIEPDAPLLAGPECPEIKANSMLYTNEPLGYCLLLPAGYSAMQVDPDATEMEFYVDSMQNAAHARLFIKVSDADGRSLEEATTEREAEIEKAVPGSDVMWSWASLLDGEPAHEFRQVPGPELSRQVLTLHNGRVYTLIFVPDGPFADETNAEMQGLYEMVMDSFSFLWQEEVPVATATATIADDLLLLWEGQPPGEGVAGERCGRLEIRAGGEASFGPCDGSPTTITFAAPYWEEIVARFAPFTAEGGAGRLQFQGRGEVDGPEWQRALANWARLTYGELASGHACAACRTVFTWSFGPLAEDPESCAILWATDFGYIYRGTVPCEGGQTEVTAEGWLETEEWIQLETWLRSRAPLTLGENGETTLLGQGTEEMNETEQATLRLWADAVAVRLQRSSPEGKAPGSLVLCPEVPRPALALFLPGEGYQIVDPLSGAECTTTLDGDVPGFFQATSDALYYTVLEDKQFVVKRLGQDGDASLLSFTAVDRDDALRFVVSPDGRRIAWSVTSAGLVSASTPTSIMWVADTDGIDTVTPLPEFQAGGADGQTRALVPVRFSEDGSTLFYTLQVETGGIWSAFVGRYDNLYALRLNGNAQPTQIFDCPDVYSRMCIGDFYDVQGQVEALAYVDDNALVIIDGAGNVLNTIELDADYLGYPTFGPQGDLVFYSAEGAASITPDEGTLYRVTAPIAQATAPEVLASGPELFLPKGWLDADHVVVAYNSGSGNWGTAVVGRDGSIQVLQSEPNAGIVEVLPATAWPH